MKFGWLIECNMRNNFLEKSYAKCGGKTIPRPFSEKSNLSISMDHCLYSLVFCMPSWGLSKYIETKLPTTCSNLIQSFSKKQKEVWDLPISFSALFLRKILLLLHSVNWPNVIVWLSLLRETLGNMCIIIVC